MIKATMSEDFTRCVVEEIDALEKACVVPLTERGKALLMLRDLLKHKIFTSPRIVIAQ